MIKVGDVVTLNSGVDRMTVSVVRGDKLTVVWPNKNGYGKLELPAVCFKKSEPKCCYSGVPLEEILAQPM